MAAHRAGGCVTGSGHAPRLAVARCLGLILRLTSAFMRRSGSGADGRSPSLRVTAAGAPGAVGEVRMRVHAPGPADGRAGGRRCRAGGDVARGSFRIAARLCTGWRSVSGWPGRRRAQPWYEAFSGRKLPAFPG